MPSLPRSRILLRPAAAGLAACLALLGGVRTAHASEAAARAGAQTSASSVAAFDAHFGVDQASATAPASAGGATAKGTATVQGFPFTNLLAPTLKATANGSAGGDEHTVGYYSTATGSWTDTLKLKSGVTIPPAAFSFHAVFICHLDGSLNGPIGAATAYRRLIIDRTDVAGNPIQYGSTTPYNHPGPINETVRLTVPIQAFLGGFLNGAPNMPVYPTFTMSVNVTATAAYNAQGEWGGDGSAELGSTYALDTIYLADAHGNPVSGYENLQIVGDLGSYKMGPPPGGFLQEMVARDRFGRRLNERGLTLVDWEGQIANPAIQIWITPPSDATFPATAVVSCPQARVYFDNPSTTSDGGPTKVITFADATPQPLRVSIFPDRDGTDEDWPINVDFTSASGASRLLILNAHVVDQDQPTRPVEFPITVDFSRDQTGYFADPAVRALYQQLANDWAYYLADPGLDTVATGAETTFIWAPTGFLSGNFITNASPYRGYLLYAYGIDQAAEPYRSGGEPSSTGGFLTAAGVSLNLRRSGGQELEVKGNYNLLGWYLTTGDSDWWMATNLGDVPNDLASIPHHEMGHAFIFNPAQPAFASFKQLGAVQEARVLAYHGSYPAIDSSDHLAGAVDRLSGRGAFGNEYNGPMPARRWLITKLDLLVAQAIGYRLRDTSPFAPASITTTALARGGVGGFYSQTLQARGGVPFYRWTVSVGSLPPGLELDSFTGTITGNPTAAGSYAFTARLEEYDETAPAVERAFTIRVESAPFVVTSVQRTPTAQVSYRTSANQTYRVEASDDLQAWTTLASGVPGTGGVVTTADPMGAVRPKRFYRITEM